MNLFTLTFVGLIPLVIAFIAMILYNKQWKKVNPYPYDKDLLERKVFLDTVAHIGGGLSCLLFLVLLINFYFSY